jgi:hypothetical protein
MANNIHVLLDWRSTSIFLMAKEEKDNTESYWNKIALVSLMGACRTILT